MANKRNKTSAKRRREEAELKVKATELVPEASEGSAPEDISDSEPPTKVLRIESPQSDEESVATSSPPPPSKKPKKKATAQSKKVVETRAVVETPNSQYP